MGHHSSKIAVLGASGSVGTATLQYYCNNPIKHIKVTAFVRDPTSAKAQANLSSLNTKTIANNIHIEQADMAGDEAQLAHAIKGHDTVFIVTPGDEHRAEIVRNALNACKIAKTKHVLVVSVLTADKTDQIFGRQFAPIEEEVKNAGINFTLVRLPLFMENNLAHLGSIRDQAEVLTTIQPDAPYDAIAVQDVGEACAKILANPRDHVNKVYVLVSRPFTMNDMARAFSEQLHKDVKCVQIPPDVAKQGFIAMGLPEWQAKGVLELMDNINKRDPIMSIERADFRLITGRDPLTIQEWVAMEQNKLHQQQQMQPQHAQQEQTHQQHLTEQHHQQHQEQLQQQQQHPNVIDASHSADPAAPRSSSHVVTSAAPEEGLVHQQQQQQQQQQQGQGAGVGGNYGYAAEDASGTGGYGVGKPQPAAVAPLAQPTNDS